MGCSNNQGAASFLLRLLRMVFAISSMLVPYAEDVFDDVSAGAVGEEDKVQSWGAVLGYTLLALVVNASSLVFDIHRLNLCSQSTCEARGKKGCLHHFSANSCVSHRTVWWLIFSIRVLFALGIFFYYATITTLGVLEDYNPYQLNSTNSMAVNETTAFAKAPAAQLLLHRLLNVIPDSNWRQAVKLGFAVLSTLLFIVTEGVSGAVFYAGEDAIRQAAIHCLSKTDEDDEEQRQIDATQRMERCVNRVNQVRLVLGAVSTFFFSLSVFLSLFDSYCILGEEEDSAALWSKRLGSAIVAVFYGMANTDYYLTQLQPGFMGGCVQSIPYRFMSALGMGAYYYAMDRDRWMLFMSLYSSEEIAADSGVNIGGYVYATLAGAVMGILRYVLAFCGGENAASADKGDLRLTTRRRSIASTFANKRPPMRSGSVIIPTQERPRATTFFIDDAGQNPLVTSGTTELPNMTAN